MSMTFHITSSTAPVTDTFHYPCWDCGQAIEVVAGQQQPHECATYDTDSERICAAYWAGYDQAWKGQGQ
jgi:hypothetical protein